MTTTLTSIRHRDAQQSAVLRKVEVPIAVALQGTTFETTACVMGSLVERMGLLKDGILDLAEAGNLYCVNVLFRVFLEHVLRTMAIFRKSSSDHSDDFARHYLKLEVNEFYQYLKACKAAGLDIEGTPKGVLDQRFSQARSLREKDVREMAEPFKYRELIKTIQGLVPRDTPSFLEKIIPNYSKLSGFIHGGPSAAQALKDLSDKNRRKEEILRIADLAVHMFHSAERWYLKLATTEVPGLQPIFEELSTAMYGEETGANKPDAAAPRTSGR